MLLSLVYCCVLIFTETFLVPALRSTEHFEAIIHFQNNPWTLVSFIRFRMHEFCPLSNIRDASLRYILVEKKLLKGLVFELHTIFGHAHPPEPFSYISWHENAKTVATDRCDQSGFHLSVLRRFDKILVLPFSHNWNRHSATGGLGVCPIGRTGRVFCVMRPS